MTMGEGPKSEVKAEGQTADETRSESSGVDQADKVDVSQEVSPTPPTGESATKEQITASKPTASEDAPLSGTTPPDSTSEPVSEKDNGDQATDKEKSEIFAFLLRQKELFTTVLFFFGAIGFMYATFATQKNLSLMECLLVQQAEMNRESNFQRERLHTAQLIQNEVLILAKAHSSLPPHEAEIYAMLENIAKQEATAADDAGTRMQGISKEMAKCYE
ncbi:hypothetical protein [Ruegeria sp. HKCCD4332]|uniref:hypothetical protein n=1 Tax=Ruegeria sp. HKCCD4332 TaxID=2683021 RepID=UPI001491D029|nr:hypothetical protein [Ruegeria sp. HKCCD4332]NOD75947.1 hypothetical protein [Ruegeria sp. HKCCD4332]